MWRRRIEIGVIVGVVALVMAVLLPAIQQARESARRTQSKNNLKQIGLALHNYHDNYNCFPPGGVFDPEGRGHHGWLFTIIPYIEASPLFNRVDSNQPWDSSRNAGELLGNLLLYRIPGEQASVGHWEFPLTHYSGNAHFLSANSCVSLKDIGETEHIAVAGEMAGDFTPWACPYNWRPIVSLNGDPLTYGRYSKAGGFFLFVDGHVEFVTNEAFPSRRATMSGPDLAGFAKTLHNIVRPMSFPCPRDTLHHCYLGFGNSRSASALKNFDGDYVMISIYYSPQAKDEGWQAHDRDIHQIVRHESLEELFVDGDFTDAALPSLGRLKQLRTLNLESDHITEVGLSFVEQLPQLESFVVQGKQITDEVRRRIQERLPECEVWQRNPIRN